jgi:hypothetical protein
MTSWYSTSWSRRLKVTVPAALFAADESDKAVFIDESLITENRFWFSVLSTGADIVVTSNDGTTKVRRQLIAINTTVKTIELYFHASVLSSTIDNVFYIYYGNAAGAEANDYADYEDYYEQYSARVAASADDCRVLWSGTEWSIDLTVNIFVGYGGSTSQSLGSGMKFLGLNLPRYSKILDSVITFTASEDRADLVVNTRLCAELTGTPSQFSTTANYQARRGTACGGADDTQHTSTIDWDGIAAWVLDTTYDTPSLNTPIQSVVTANAVQDLVIFWDDHDERGTQSNTRRREAYSYNGIAAKAPLLTVNYIPLRAITIAFDSTRWGALSLTPARTSYDIEVRDNNGLLLYRIVDIEAATLDQQVNNPAAASLTCPMSPSIEAALSSIQRPNQLWVWKNGELFFTGNMSLIDIAHSSLESVRIDSLDWMNQLKDEFVEYYDASDTVDDHVEAFLAEQVDTRPVLLGTIEPALSRDITIERDTIYNALMSMRDTAGGYMVVDPYRKLHWYWTLSASTGQQIRYKKNLVGITKAIDWMNFGNRLYIYGDGVDLTDAGYATTYIEDDTSIDTYGLVIRKIYKQSFASAATMLEFAYLKIQEMAFPRITYTVDIANLEDFGFSEDELALGSWLTLIDEEIGVNVDVQIVRIIWDLVKCEKIQIELAVKSSDICDIVPGVYVL